MEQQRVVDEYKTLMSTEVLLNERARERLTELKALIGSYSDILTTNIADTDKVNEHPRVYDLILAVSCYLCQTSQ